MIEPIINPKATPLPIPKPMFPSKSSNPKINPRLAPREIPRLVYEVDLSFTDRSDPWFGSTLDGFITTILLILHILFIELKLPGCMGKPGSY
jgi:hypothetical protein